MKTCACGQPFRPEWHHSERCCHGMAVTSADIRALRFARPVFFPLEYRPRLTPPAQSVAE